jgi:hypothetical protein
LERFQPNNLKSELTFTNVYQLPKNKIFPTFVLYLNQNYATYY